jgi:hypothetical protein
MSTPEHLRRRIHFSDFRVDLTLPSTRPSHHERGLWVRKELVGKDALLLTDQEAERFNGILDQLYEAVQDGLKQNQDTLREVADVFSAHPLRRIFTKKRRKAFHTFSQTTDNWRQIAEVVSGTVQNLKIYPKAEPTGGYTNIEYRLVTPGDDLVKPRELIILTCQGERKSHTAEFELLGGKITEFYYQYMDGEETGNLQVDFPRGINKYRGKIKVGGTMMLEGERPVATGNPLL